SAADSTYLLEVFYSLDATVTRNVVPPSPFTAGSASYTFGLTATLKETMIPTGGNIMPVWLFNGFMTEHGTVNAVISSPDPATGMEQEAVQWTFTTITFDRGSPSGFAPDSWQEEVHHQSTGTEVVVSFEDGDPDQPLITGQIYASFTQLDQVTACVRPVA